MVRKIADSDSATVNRHKNRLFPKGCVVRVYVTVDLPVRCFLARARISVWEVPCVKRIEWKLARASVRLALIALLFLFASDLRM